MYFEHTTRRPSHILPSLPKCPVGVYLDTVWDDWQHEWGTRVEVLGIMQSRCEKFSFATLLAKIAGTNSDEVTSGMRGIVPDKFIAFHAKYHQKPTYMHISDLDGNEIEYTLLLKVLIRGDNATCVLYGEDLLRLRQDIREYVALWKL